MHTDQIAEKILDGYKNEKLSNERMDLLFTQANEQLDEIAQNKEVYDSFLQRANAPKNVERNILWMILMSDEDIVEDYIDEFGKKFREIIPVSDIADLLLYYIHKKKVEKIDVDGFDYLLDAELTGIDEADQFCFTNVLLYIQKSKEVAIDF